MPQQRIYASNADRQRAYRQRHRPKPIKLPPAPLVAVGDEGAAVAKWAASRLVVPPGHPHAGQPFELPAFLVAFLSDALTHRESLLCIARKNAKSAAAAVLLLAYLVGPLRRPGFRAGIVSINRAKAGELRAQMEEIASASNLAGLDFWKSPAPGWVQGPEGRCDILSADRSAGHASGFDLAVIDELGLLAERDRELVAGMRTATSAKDGRFLALTIHGSGPFVAEVLDRRGEPGLALHHYAADPDAKLDDPQEWQAANPGLGTIKSLSYMQAESRRVLATPADQQHFRAHDLNVPASPTVELICGLDDWKACLAPEDELPARSGWCCIGIDLGASASMTAALCRLAVRPAGNLGRVPVIAGIGCTRPQGWRRWLVHADAGRRLPEDLRRPGDPRRTVPARRRRTAGRCPRRGSRVRPLPKGRGDSSAGGGSELDPPPRAPRNRGQRDGRRFA